MSGIYHGRSGFPSGKTARLEGRSAFIGCAGAPGQLPYPPPHFMRPALSPVVRPSACALVALAILVCLPGCPPKDPLLTVVAASTPGEFASWQRREWAQATTAQRSDLEAALQEFRYQIMGEGKAKGSAAIDETLFAQINRLTVREVLIRGLKLKLTRLERDHGELDFYIRQNARLRTNPGDVAAADYLERKHRDQTARLAKLSADIAQTAARLTELGASTAPASAPDGASGKPDKAKL